MRSHDHPRPDVTRHIEKDWLLFYRFSFNFFFCLFFPPFFISLQNSFKHSSVLCLVVFLQLMRSPFTKRAYLYLLSSFFITNFNSLPFSRSSSEQREKKRYEVLREITTIPALQDYNKVERFVKNKKMEMAKNLWNFVRWYPLVSGKRPSLLLTLFYTPPPDSAFRIFQPFQIHCQ